MKVLLASYTGSLVLSLTKYRNYSQGFTYVLGFIVKIYLEIIKIFSD